MDRLSSALVYGFLFLALVPLALLGTVGFATGPLGGGVTLSQFTYGLVLLSIVGALALGSLVGIRRDDSDRSGIWARRAVGVSMGVTAIAVAVSAALSGEWGAIPLLVLSVGVFWFSVATYALSLGYVASARTS